MIEHPDGIGLHTVTPDDIPDLERCRADDVTAGPADSRMAAYLRGSHHPQDALRARVIYAARDEDDVPVGYIGGHLTRRYACDGELQYLYVVPAWRRRGVATAMLRALARWFAERNARRVCVDVEPANAPARAFYARHGATELNTHWMVWPNIADVGDPGARR